LSLWRFPLPSRILRLGAMMAKAGFDRISLSDGQRPASVTLARPVMCPEPVESGVPFARTGGVLERRRNRLLAAALVRFVTRAVAQLGL
jgi:hypothetical protein